MDCKGLLYAIYNFIKKKKWEKKRKKNRIRKDKGSMQHLISGL